MVEEIGSTDELVFSTQEVEEKVTEVIESVLQNQVYDEALVPQWINAIVEKVMKSLYDTGKPYKYVGIINVVTCLIMQRTGSGLQTSYSCFYETGSDCKTYSVSFQYGWPKEKGGKDQGIKSVHCIVTVFCAAY